MIDNELSKGWLAIAKLKPLVERYSCQPGQGEKNKAREGEQGKNTVRIEENF